MFLQTGKLCRQIVCHLYNKLERPNKKKSLDTEKVCREIFSHLEQAWRVKSINFSTHRKDLQRHFVTFMASLKDQINRTVVQRNDMPHVLQACKSTNSSVHRIIPQRNLMSPLEQAWRVKSTNVFTYRTVVQRNVMPHLGQVWRVKSTNFLTQKKVLQRKFATFTASLNGQINKFLCTQ